MELIEISQNLSQISKHLALLQKYISFKFGSDWAKDFKNYCDNDNQTDLDFEIEDDTVDELRNPLTTYDNPSAKSLDSNKTRMNLSTDMEVYHVKTEDLEEEEVEEHNVNKEMFCVDFEDVESFQNCKGDPLSTSETFSRKIRQAVAISSISSRSNVTSEEDRLADLTLGIVPVLAVKSGATNPTRSIRPEPSKSTVSSARKTNRRARIRISTATYSNNSQPTSTRTSASDYIQRGDRWECGICGNDFTLRCTLTRHLKIHRGVTIPCLDKNCTKVFTRNHYMQNHYKSAHLVSVSCVMNPEVTKPI